MVTASTRRSATSRAYSIYYESNDKPLKRYAVVLSQKPYIYVKHFAPHDIAVRALSTCKSHLEAAK